MGQQYDNEQLETIGQLREILTSTSEEDKAFMSFLEDVGLLDDQTYEEAVQDLEDMDDVMEAWTKYDN